MSVSMEDAVRKCLGMLDDSVVAGLPDQLSFDEMCEEYRASKPAASPEDMAIACIQYALQQSFPELFEPLEADEHERESEEKQPVQEASKSPQEVD